MRFQSCNEGSLRAETDATALRCIFYHIRREWYRRSNVPWLQRFPRPLDAPIEPTVDGAAATERTVVGSTLDCKASLQAVFAVPWSWVAPPNATGTCFWGMEERDPYWAAVRMARYGRRGIKRRSAWLPLKSNGVAAR